MQFRGIVPFLNLPQGFVAFLFQSLIGSGYFEFQNDRFPSYAGVFQKNIRASGAGFPVGQNDIVSDIFNIPARKP